MSGDSWAIAADFDVMTSTGRIRDVSDGVVACLVDDIVDRCVAFCVSATLDYWGRPSPDSRDRTLHMHADEMFRTQ